MPNFEKCEIELGPLLQDTGIDLTASLWEDETGTIPADGVVSASETLYIKVEWSLTGHARSHFCGKWRVKIDLESIGTADEYTGDLVEYDMDPCKDDAYLHTFALTPGLLNPHPGGTVYLVATTLSSLDPCGDPGHIWGYCTGPSVMFVP